MIRILSARLPDKVDRSAPLTPPVLPTAPTGAATIHAHQSSPRASSRLRAAVSEVVTHLYPAMRSTTCWDEEGQNRCVWSSAAAAEYLRRRGIRARVIYGACMVNLVDAAGETQWLGGALRIGLPDARTGHPGLHALVEVADTSGPWLLELNLWQAKRPRFPGLPDAALVSKDLNRRIDAYPEYRVGGMLPRDADGYRVHLLTAPTRRWRRGSYGDLQHDRATSVADIMEERVRTQVDALAT